MFVDFMLCARATSGRAPLYEKRGTQMCMTIISSIISLYKSINKYKYKYVCIYIYIHTYI